MAEETLADLFLAAGVRGQQRPRPLSMRPAWQRTPEANTPYRAPQQALADRNTVPYLRQETRNERRQQSDLAQFALEHEAARNEVNTPPGTYLGQDALEMTGLPSVARGIGHLRDQEPGQALPEVALGGLGVLGMVAGGGARTPRARPPMRAALPEIPAEAPRLPNAPARLPGRATDGSVLPIRPPQPIRQSMVGGSDDLAEAAAMRPQVQGDPEALSLARSWIDTFGGGPDAEARAIAVMKQHAREATHPLRRQLLEEAVASVRSRQYVRGEPNTFSARVEEAWPEIYGSRSGPDAGPVQGGRGTEPMRVWRSGEAGQGDVTWYAGSRQTADGYTATNGGTVSEHTVAPKRPLIVDLAGRQIDELRASEIPDATVAGAIRRRFGANRSHGDAVAQAARDAGYDAVIFRNARDPAVGFEGGQPDDIVAMVGGRTAPDGGPARNGPRLDAEGWDERSYYHGGPEGIEQLDLSRARAGNYGPGIYVSRNADIAGKYANAEHGRSLYQVQVRPGRTLDLNTPEGRAEYQSLSTEELHAKYDSLRAPGETVIFNPENVRARTGPNAGPPPRPRPPPRRTQ